MREKALFLMTDARHFGVTYQINPWMRPQAWHADQAGLKSAALASAAALRDALKSIGAAVETVPAVAGLPDLVFPANAAIVLDGRVLVARFRHPERQGEEKVFRRAFLDLKDRGLVDEVIDLPKNVLQEGAGDCIWDKDRGFFWAGHGQRSTANSLPVIADTFGRPVVGLKLATDRFYHLDTCFCPLVRRQAALLSASLHGRRSGRDPCPCAASKIEFLRPMRTPQPSASMPSISGTIS